MDIATFLEPIVADSVEGGCWDIGNLDILFFHYCRDCKLKYGFVIFWIGTS
jgi:hypothetical protein